MATGEVPQTLARALDPQWLSAALAEHAGGVPVTHVETVEVIRTVATKVRFAATFGDGETRHYCLKGLLDVDAATARGGSTMVLEADFYGRVAGRVNVRVPDCVAAVVDRDAAQGVIIMRDLITGGAQFCSALEPFTAEDAAASLNQIVALNAGSDVLADSPWIGRRIDSLARAQYVTPVQLQEMLDGPRGDLLPPHVRNAEALIAAMRKLAALDAGRPQFLLHGDSHAGNAYRTAQGPGLIDWQLLQRGGWALDAAYHICAVLPVDLAEREERNLLGHYLETMRGHGLTMPDDEAAWLLYRQAAVYGYYLWAITRRVDPAIINVFVPRLGLAVARHDSFALLDAA